MRRILLFMLVVLPTGCQVRADEYPSALSALIQSSCISCHDSGSETGLDLSALAYELSRKDTFDHWESVYDRLESGEMPPASEDRPDPKLKKQSLTRLHADLKAFSLQRQRSLGRVRARRLTKLELGYTLQDLLLIQTDVTRNVPDETESGSFDNVGESQRISAVHMESYLQAADDALDNAIKLGRNPYRTGKADFGFLEQWHDKPLELGGSVTRKLKYGDGFAFFVDTDYLTSFQFPVNVPGTYRIKAKVAAYQSDENITAKIIIKDPTGAATLAKMVDLVPGNAPEWIQVETFLKPGDNPYLTLQMDMSAYSRLFAAGGSKNYQGPGLAILAQEIEGPLYEQWPPASTMTLLQDLDFTSPAASITELFQQALSSEAKPNYQVEKPSDQLRAVTKIVRSIASRMFRRPVSDQELQPFIELAKPAIEQQRDFLEVARVPLRAMLSSPQFLMFPSGAGPLDDHALASRLSYFLWKSMPDDELFAVAKSGKLSEPAILVEQVDRMLDDPKSDRFIKDFLGQWLRLHKLNATTPDDSLYPEFDELLSNSIRLETELFFAELVRENLSLDHVIDSDFTFLNGRLAQHYKIDGVAGQSFRKVALPEGSPRGGVLTQAAVLKTTANGTTTSPVTRGNFVLTNLLGTPPSPPPANVGSIEPDTRGKTTIREILAAHRDNESCASCHREIDPPGFALESFDPIGGFRTHYRATSAKTYQRGPQVDPSGTTAEGQKFDGIDEFKHTLMAQREQIARHFVSQLVVYSTGAEIAFADRAEIELILDRNSESNHAVRDLIQDVVQSRLFRNQ